MSNGKLEGKKALICGVANERSLGWAIAKALHAEGAQLFFSYQNEKLKDRVIALAESVGSGANVAECDISSDEQISNLFGAVASKWNSLDILIHSIAFANSEDLDGKFSNTSRKGFFLALDTSVYSLIALSREAEKLMTSGGNIITLSYYGSQKVIPNYNVMGVAKAALESSVRYLAYDLGPRKIRVNALSAGPVKTLAACGIKNFRDMLKIAAEKNPLKENISQEDVGAFAGFLCSDAARHLTGNIFNVDSGLNIMGV